MKARTSKMKWPSVFTHCFVFALFAVLFEGIAAQGCSANTCGACTADPSCTWCLMGNGVADPNNPGHCTDLGNTNNCVAFVKEDEESSFCSGQGELTCHGCQCNLGWIGNNCECYAEDDNDEYCKPRGDAALCYGQGECVCGACMCDPLGTDPNQRYSGRFCECNDYSCDFYNGALCSGPDQGVCRCGTCVCAPGYTGPDCGCPTSIDTCTDLNGLICGGHGICECGRCICEAPYLGPGCSECPTCLGMCEQLKDCAECKGFQTGPLSQDTCSDRCLLFTSVESLDSNDRNRRLCKFRDEDDCEFVFSYSTDHMAEVFVQQTKVCSPGQSAAMATETVPGTGSHIVWGSLVYISWIVGAYLLT